MLLALIPVILVLSILILIHLDIKKGIPGVGEVGAFLFGLAIFDIILVICISLFSYETYLADRADYDAIISQYRQSIEMYDERAILHLDKKSLTDFKYQGYQENTAKLIKELRFKVSSYNESIIKKKILKKNIIWGWFISAPDKDMKIIQLNE